MTLGCGVAIITAAKPGTMTGHDIGGTSVMQLIERDDQQTHLTTILEDVRRGRQLRYNRDEIERVQPDAHLPLNHERFY
jgi:hypothetical protein